MERSDPWFRRHRDELRLALRSTVAALIAFALGHLLGMRQVYWAVLTAIIVMQGSVGGSFKAAFDRLVGTLGGAVWGVAVFVAIPRAGLVSVALALAVAVAPLATLVAFRPAYRTAPVTAVIVLLGSLSQQAGPVLSAADRVLEIFVGSVVAIAVSLLVLPARAHGLLAQTAARVLDLLSEDIRMLPASLAAGADAAAVKQLNDRIRSAIVSAEAVAGDAAHETAIRLTDAPDPDPLVRTLRRVRNDLITVGRATVEPLPEPVRSRLAEPAAQLSAEIAKFLIAAGVALTSRTPAPSTTGVGRALDDYAAVMDEVRRDRLTRDLPAEAVRRIFGLAFALEQLRQNLADLADRVRERTRSGPAPTAVS